MPLNPVKRVRELIRVVLDMQHRPAQLLEINWPAFPIFFGHLTQLSLDVALRRAHHASILGSQREDGAVDHGGDRDAVARPIKLKTVACLQRDKATAVWVKEQPIEGPLRYQLIAADGLEGHAVFRLSVIR